MIKEIKILIKNNNESNNTSKINEIRFLLSESNKIYLELFNRKKLNINQYFSLSEILLLFLEEQNIDNIIIYDKFVKIKNYFLFKIFFSSLGSLIQTMFTQNNSNDLISNLDFIFDYLQTLISNKEINNIYNHQILINKKIIQSFVNILLEAIIYNNNEEIEKYTDKLIYFYIHFIKYNLKQSNLIEKMININKNAFLNLNNFSENKNQILQDIYIQNFYYKLLDDPRLKENFPSINNFLFNGKDSKITLKLNQIKLEETTMLFSFNINDNNNTSQIYPLITIYNESEKENKFKIYLKYNKKKSNIKNIQFTLFLPPSIEIDIQINKTYYIAIGFDDNRVYYNIFPDYFKNCFKEEGEKNIRIKDIKANILKIGHDDENEKFSGLLGPIILIKNQKLYKKKNFLHYFIRF